MSKTLIIIFGLLGLITVAVIGGSYYWWTHSGKDFLESAGNDYEDALKSGASMNEQACYERAVATMKSPDGQSFGAAIRNGVTMKGCLQTSKLSPSFCTGIPAQSEIMASAAWEVSTCAKIGAGGQLCQSLVREVPRYCSSPERAAKLARGG